MIAALKILLFFAILSNIFSYEIPDNARQMFAMRLFHRLCPNYGKLNYVLSPAAAQKSLVLLYNASANNNNLRDKLLHDLKFKYIDTEEPFDLDNALDMSKAEVKDDDVYEYFVKDFNEIGNGFNITNYIISSAVFAEEFSKFAKEYFNTETINRKKELAKMDEFEKLKAAFNVNTFDSENLEFWSSIELKTTFRHVVNYENGKMRGTGNFRYAKLENYEIIDLPLNTQQKEQELILTIFKPNDQLSHTYFVFNIDGEMKDMNYYDKDLNWQLIDVILPEFKFENVSYVGDAFYQDDYGMKLLLTEKWTTRNAFKHKSNSKKLQFLWQRTFVQLTPRLYGGETISEKPQTTFDVSNSSFIYFIKSKDVLYFVGTRFVPEPAFS